MFSFNLCCSPVLYSIILFLPPPLPRCLLSSLSVHFPYGNRFPMRFSGPPLTHRQAYRPRARGRGRSVISPVLSLTWNIWHCDTSKERDFCVCMCTICECRDVKFYKRGEEKERQRFFFFFHLVSSSRICSASTVGWEKHQPGLKSWGQTGLAFVSAPVVCENTATSFCLKSLQRQKGSTGIWILVVSSEVKMYLFAGWWPRWVQWMSSSWHSVYTCRDYIPLDLDENHILHLNLTDCQSV